MASTAWPLFEEGADMILEQTGHGVHGKHNIPAPPGTKDSALLEELVEKKDDVHGQHNIPPPKGTKGVSDMQEDLLAPVAEFEEVSTFSDEFEMTKQMKTRLVTKIKQATGNVRVAMNQFISSEELVGTKWPHHLGAPFHVDTKHKFICWPHSCIEVKCGKNHSKNREIAKKSKGKVMRQNCLKARKAYLKRVERQDKRDRSLELKAKVLAEKEKAAKLKAKELAAKKKEKKDKDTKKKERAKKDAEKAAELKAKETRLKEKVAKDKRKEMAAKELADKAKAKEMTEKEKNAKVKELTAKTLEHTEKAKEKHVKEGADKVKKKEKDAKALEKERAKKLAEHKKQVAKEKAEKKAEADKKEKTKKEKAAKEAAEKEKEKQAKAAAAVEVAGKKAKELKGKETFNKEKVAKEKEKVAKAAAKERADKVGEQKHKESAAKSKEKSDKAASHKERAAKDEKTSKALEAKINKEKTEKAKAMGGALKRLTSGHCKAKVTEGHCKAYAAANSKPFKHSNGHPTQAACFEHHTGIYWNPHFDGTGKCTHGNTPWPCLCPVSSKYACGWQSKTFGYIDNSHNLPGTPARGKTLNQCISLCDKTKGCQAFSYKKGHSTSDCWLKNSSHPKHSGNGGNSAWYTYVVGSCTYSGPAPSLTCRTDSASSNNAGIVHARPAGGYTLTGGGMNNRYRHFDAKSGFEEMHPSGNNFQCDTGFGPGQLNCYARSCTTNHGALTCTTTSTRFTGSGVRTATLPAGYTMTGGGLYNHYRHWNARAGFEESRPDGNGWRGDMGFGWGDYTVYARGCRAPAGTKLTCTTAASGRANFHKVACPAGYQVTGCGINNHKRSWNALSAFEEAWPSFNGCQCDTGFGTGDNTCYARCCKLDRA